MIINDILLLIDGTPLLTFTGSAILNTSIVFESNTYDPVLQRFQTRDGLIDLDWIPNENATPNDSFYYVVLQSGRIVVRLKWYILDRATARWDQVIVLEEPTGDLIYENDPRAIALLADTNNNDTLDVLEQSYIQLIDVPVEAKNGVNTVFTTSQNYKPGKLKVFLNGQQTRGVELSANSYMISEPPVAQDEIVASYQVL